MAVNLRPDPTTRAYHRSRHHERRYGDEFNRTWHAFRLVHNPSAQWLGQEDIGVERGDR